MSTLATVFRQHLIILRGLQDKIGDLQQAYYKQKDRKKVWREVDDILLALRNGCRFLDFPEEEELLNQLQAEDVIIDDENTNIKGTDGSQPKRITLYDPADQIKEAPQFDEESNHSKHSSRSEKSKKPKHKTSK